MTKRDNASTNARARTVSVAYEWGSVKVSKNSISRDVVTSLAARAKSGRCYSEDKLRAFSAVIVANSKLWQSRSNGSQKIKVTSERLSIAEQAHLLADQQEIQRGTLVLPNRNKKIPQNKKYCVVYRELDASHREACLKETPRCLLDRIYGQHLSFVPRRATVETTSPVPVLRRRGVLGRVLRHCLTHPAARNQTFHHPRRLTPRHRYTPL